ncbi:MAG: glycosyltransferase family 8 protein [Vitreimonas sp.]
MNADAPTLTKQPTAAPARTDVIDVAFGFDNNYTEHGAAVMAAVASYGGAYRFIILHVGVDAAAQKRVESVAPNASFIWVEVGDDDVPAFANRQHFSRATLFRLGLEKLAPADCHKLLYLDADITVLRDVRELYAIDLGDDPIAGAIDAFVDPAAFARSWSLPTGADYFNAGVLVIDLDRVRVEKLFTKAAEFVALYDPPLNDQDALNFACWGRWKRFSVAWNAQRHMAIATLTAEMSEDKHLGNQRPRIIHFTGPEKPWLPNVYHPWAWLYWQSLKRTPFFADVASRYHVDAKERARMLLRFVRRWRWLSPA